MIQRIQTAYLLLSALLLGLMFFLPLAQGSARKLGFPDHGLGIRRPDGQQQSDRQLADFAATTLLGATIVLEIITVSLQKTQAPKKRLCTAQIMLLDGRRDGAHLKSFGEEGFGPVAPSR